MKKSLKKQAVFPVLMLLVVTALALIGSSFAWFSMASTASVTTIEGTVEDAGLGLMISQDASTFTSNVTMGTSAQTYVVPSKFHQISTVNAVDFYNATILEKNSNGTATSIQTTADTSVKYENGIAQGIDDASANPATYKTSGVASNASYMVFDLFFQAENAGKLYLDYGTALTDLQVNSVTGNATKAMRVAFIPYATAANGASAITASASGSIHIWEPNPTGTGDSKILTYGVVAPDTMAPYTEVASKATLQTTYESSKFFNGQKWNTDSNQPDGNIESIAVLGVGVTKVRVVVWLEGNDPECVSTIAANRFSLSLYFFAKKD